MTMQLVFQILLACMMALVAIYLFICILRMRSAPKLQADMLRTAEENTQAVLENSRLLRDLIDINHQLLKQRESTGA